MKLQYFSILLAIFAVILTGCAKFAYEIDLSQVQAEDKTLPALKNTTSRIWDCKEIKTQRLADGCYLDNANFTSNLSFCDKMGEYSNHGINKPICYLAVLEANADAYLCERIKRSDEDMTCSKFANPEELAECEFVQNISKEYYKTPYLQFKNKCFLSSAKKDNDIEMCKKIVEEDTHKIIQQDCYYYFALQKDDANICDNVENEFDRGLCYDYYYDATAKIKRNPQLCEKIDENRTTRGLCYSQLAISLSNISICNNMKTKNPKSSENCLTDYAYEKQDLKVCNKILDKYYKSYCYGSVASKIEHKAVCNSIYNKEHRNICFWAYNKNVISDPDVSVCNNKEFLIEIEYNNSDECYLDYGIYTLEISICDKIENNEIKEYCYFKVQQPTFNTIRNAKR